MQFFLTVLIQIFLFIAMTQSFNLLYGYTNMLFLGIVGMTAVGAYAGSLLMLAGVNVWLALLMAMLMSSFCGLLIAIPTVRLKADYLAIATLGFGEIIRSVLLNWTSVTRGPLGLPGIPRPSLFGIVLEENWQFLLFVTVVVFIIMLFYYRLTHSPFGKILETIREDDVASRSIGKRINAYRTIIIVITGALVGLIGTLNAMFIRFTEPRVYSLEYLGLILLAVFAGGPGSYWGAIVAGTILMTVRESMLLIDIAPSIIGPLQWIILGSVLVGILIYKPSGLFGKKFIAKNY